WRQPNLERCTLPTDTRVSRTIGCQVPKAPRHIQSAGDSVLDLPAPRWKEACSKTTARQPRFPSHSFLQSPWRQDRIPELRAVLKRTSAVFCATVRSSLLL